jgi:serine/threonine protein kinase
MEMNLKCELFYQLSDGLNYIHAQSIIHRENILVNKKRKSKIQILVLRKKEQIC